MRDRESPDRESPHRDELDALLDAALATYADPASSSDIASQVFASVRESGRCRRRYGRLPWAIAVPVFAALLMMVLIPMRHARSRGRTSTTVANLSSPFERPQPLAHHPATPQERPSEPAQTQAAPLVDRGVSPHRTAPLPIQSQQPSDKSLPKQEVFPTPAPLSKDEQALVAFVDRSPGKVAQAVAQSQQQPVEPIDIAAIRIQPIDTSLNAASGNGGN
ncbi:hypothetical protein HNQ77_003336 [Silvibacterium bohemicum]|uniref:Uncharacterized protein n=1 Tax=Silvibacterium bohemicum TaxID=1577686 RepID=A0A841K420_9BACT|nr:hypothetical protein [Silvibacterium bohemicum]MBB6145378.1 hypothetical protein [Silvibacterium bohemicum]